MQAAATRQLTGVGVCSPRPAGHREFCKYLADSLTGGIGLAANGAEAHGVHARCDPCLREDPGQEN